MKKRLSLFVLLLITLTGLIHGQNDYYNQIMNLKDTSIIEFESKTTNYAPYGGTFTPHGTFKVLVIYAGFYTDGVYADNQELYDPNAPDGIIWNSDDGSNTHLTVPDYSENGCPPELFFTDASQLNDPQYTNTRNLTRYYYENSMGNFIMLGDVFKDPDPNSATYGEPIRINIDVTGFQSNDQWGEANRRVLEKIRLLYEDYWDDIWSPFDNKTNNPNFNNDYSGYSPDGKVDFVIIHWRYHNSWPPAGQPLPNMPNWPGSNGGVAGLASYSFGNYTIGTGHTITSGWLDPQACVEFFPHEFAHVLYNAPHYMGANSTPGNYFYFPTAGWGMMSSNIKAIHCANSWEKWLLGWNELETGYLHENSDIQTANDLNYNGEYILRDFQTTGDAIRIKIPDATNTFLWIENHQKQGLFDYKPWEGVIMSPDDEAIPDVEQGIYMFIENEWPTRDNYNLGVGTTYVNRIKPLNAQGNFDYTRSNRPLETTVSGYPNIIHPDYFCGNATYTFDKQSENPISGTNSWFRFIDDYPEYTYIPAIGKKQFSANPDGIIERYYDLNSCYTCEWADIIRETDGSNEYMLYENTYGINDEADTYFNYRSDAFQLNDEVSLSGIVPALNLPSYNSGTYKINNYLLNGLNISIIDQDVNGNFTVKIQFDDYELRDNKRLTGYIDLGNTTNDIYPDLVVKSGITLTIDKSGIPNSTSSATYADFINPTIFTCKTGSYMSQEYSSDVSVENYSTLVLKSGSIYEVNDGAILNINSNSTLVLETGSELVVNDGGLVLIEETGTLDFQGGTITLNDNSSVLEIAGTLEIADNTTFTFTGDGYLKFSNSTSEPHNITAGTNSGFVLNGSTAQTDKILEVAQTSIYIPENVATFTINDGLVHMSNNYARIVPEGSNTDITITDVLFSPQSLYRTDHRGLVICGQENVIISGCRFIKGQYGVYAYLSWMGNSLEINTSEFEDNDYGVWENGVSIMLSECTFEDNTYGLYAQATSLDDNSITDCSFTGSDYPVRYVSCAGDLLMENSEVEGALTSAVEVNGSHTFTGICNEITDADNTGYAGLYATSNAIVDLGSTGYGESNYFADNYYHVKFSNANYFYLNNGFNMFYPNNTTNNYKFYGTLNKYACGIRYPTINALNNQWYLNPGTPLSSSPAHYNVMKYGLCAEYYTINGTSPTEFEYCIQGFSMLAGEGETSINEELANNLAVNFQQNMNNAFETAETSGNWGNAHDYCWQVFQTPVPTASYSNIDYWDFAWVGLSHCTKKLYSGTNSNANNQTYLAHTFNALEKMKQFHIANDARLFFLETEKAIFNRLAGDYTTALGILDNIISNTTDSAELAYAERWRCIMQVEQDVIAGNISLSEIQDYTANCALIEGMGTKSLMLANPENNFNIELINIKIVPNPVTAQSEIIVSLPEKTEGIIEITDIHGRNIKSYPAIGNSNISITNNQFPKGIYTVKLISEDGEVKTARMIIQ